MSEEGARFAREMSGESAEEEIEYLRARRREAEARRGECVAMCAQLQHELDDARKRADAMEMLWRAEQKRAEALESDREALEIIAGMESYDDSVWVGEVRGIVRRTLTQENNQA